MAKSRGKKEHSLDDDFNWTDTLNGKVSDESFVVDSFFPPAEVPLPVTSVKRVANGYQTGSKEVAEQVANGYQTGSKEVAEPTDEQIDLSSKWVAEQVAGRVANGYQTGSKEVADFRFETLSGKERQLFNFVLEQCQHHGSLVTPPLTKEALAITLQVTRNRVKNVIHRVLEKRVLIRHEFQIGRGGWIKFRLEKDLFQRAVLNRMGSNQVANGYQIGSKWVSKSVAERVAEPSSSSSLLDLENSKTTTTGEPELLGNSSSQLSPEWQALDVAPLAEIGFSQTHLIQIIRQGKLQSSEVQESIHFFAFDLKRNGKGTRLKGSPLNFFMGILRKGIPYAPPENFESPVDEARRKTREFKERKERERQAEEQKIKDLEFSAWKQDLTSDELAALLPEFARKPGQLQDSALKSHFETSVWPERAQEILGLEKLNRAEIGKQIEQAIGEATR